MSPQRSIVFSRMSRIVALAHPAIVDAMGPSFSRSAREEVEIQALLQYLTELAFRPGSRGKLVPRDIIRAFTPAYGGEEIFRADLHSRAVANPHIAFHTAPIDSGDMVFQWTDDHSQVVAEPVLLVAA